MADIVTPEVRSRMMSRIRGRNTRPEMALRKALHRKGLRFRLNAKELPGSPDIVLPRWKTVLFVHGCYWHRHHGCRKTTTPASNVEFWAEKFRLNVERDARNIRDLREAGWRVGVVWECAVGREPSPDLVEQLVEFIISKEPGRMIFE
ncbi:DNA mismatch endonuclease Vsr [uncultured Ruegeria sp.]|uniref:very short patch repair endonuclease n=1 Tax=uncultured Ruegeria sp. TaxID=259304 RepID=UPI002613556D|nr:DNA mismatch endonuclease Vsr [uncultured Ruegeria sp.]